MFLRRGRRRWVCIFSCSRNTGTWHHRAQSLEELNKDLTVYNKHTVNWMYSWCTTAAGKLPVSRFIRIKQIFIWSLAYLVRHFLLTCPSHTFSRLTAPTFIGIDDGFDANNQNLRDIKCDKLPKDTDRWRWFIFLSAFKDLSTETFRHVCNWFSNHKQTRCKL